MADGTSAFILEILELLRWANDTTTLDLYYPTVKRAAQWQMNVSRAFKVPTKLQTTYDILNFPQYDVAAYNSVFHMAAMAATAQLAQAAGDPSFGEACTRALKDAQAAFETLQWNHTLGAYNAGSSGCTSTGCAYAEGLFADSFYGQVLAFSAGLGTLGDAAHLESHLTTQLQRNCVSFDHGKVVRGRCPNGMVVLTGRPNNRSINKQSGCDLQVWEMANPNHATLGLHLGLDADEMLGVFQPSATSWSQRINNQWDTAGIKDTDGYGTVSSHYGALIESSGGGVGQGVL